VCAVDVRVPAGDRAVLGAGPETPFFEITKSVEAGSKVLNAWPVGAPIAPAPADGGAGIVTTRGCGSPAPS
jgi:hypothetical protein